MVNIEWHKTLLLQITVTSAMLVRTGGSRNLTKLETYKDSLLSRNARAKEFISELCFSTVKLKLRPKHLKLMKNYSFLSASATILVTVFLVIATYVKWLKLNFVIGPYYFGHWLGWIGAVYIAFATPAFYVLKRRYSKRLSSMVGFHIFGNLFAFMLISLHFAQQISRPPEFFPELGTGIIQYVAVLLLVSTGFVHKYHTLETRYVASSRKQLHRYHQKMYRLIETDSFMSA